MGLSRDCYLHCKNNTKRVNTLREQNVDFRDVKTGATYSRPFPNVVLQRLVLTIRSWK